MPIRGRTSADERTLRSGSISSVSSVLGGVVENGLGGVVDSEPFFGGVTTTGLGGVVALHIFLSGVVALGGVARGGELIFWF